MKVNAKMNNENLYLYLSGEIDQSVAGDLRIKIDDYLESVKVKNVILNMQELTFMDSTGVGLILGRYKKLRQKHVGMFIDKPNEQIDKVLKVSGLYRIIPKL
ncbi:MAG: anti-sigma factor antagonist [Clostridia bacterium]|nr:anti-sigma factor antagonist [Clostridia bacterium]